MASRREVDRLQSGLDGRVRVEYRDEIAIIWLECGENRFNNHFLKELDRALDDVLDHPNVKALITTANGKFFSNGLDLNWLKELASISGDDTNTFVKTWHRIIKKVLLFPMPTVAAINGHAFAGGAFLSLAHDYRVMNTGRGWWSINEVHLGLQIPKWLVKLLTTKIPGSKAQVDTIVYGKRQTAEEVLAHGIVDKVTSPRTLLDEAIQMAKEVYGKVPPLNRDTVKMMKEDTFREVVEIEEGDMVESNRSKL